jgi:tRNA(adenine34) deaminase
MHRPPADHSELDRAMMERCIALSAKAAELGELPFAAVIAESERVIAETTNRVNQNSDITQHAELLAISEAQKARGRKNLSGCTLYSNVEPCVMCAFPMREARISRVVYAISSPMMGGFSRWNVLRDLQISETMPEAFGPVPEVIAGLLQRRAESVWRRWNPIAWAVIKHRGCFGPAAATEKCGHMPAIAGTSSLLHSLFMLHGKWRPFWIRRMPQTKV